MPNMDVQAVLTANTADFDTKMLKSGEVATATARATAKAAKQASDAQAFAAKFAADTVSAQSLRIIAAQKNESAASGEYRKALALNKAGHLDEVQGANLAAAALQRLTAAKEATALASKVEAEATGHSVSQQMAASAAIRSMEGNPGIRSIERFITTIPGVGTALQAIFPFIGAAGLAGLAFEAGEKLYEMGYKATHAAEATRAAFSDMHEKAQINIDDLTLENDRIQDQIDKLSGHPNNGLRTSLDESRKMADQLLVSLQADRKELEALLKENSVGTFAGVLTGVASTGQQDKELVADSKGLSSDLASANVTRNSSTLAADGDATKIKAATDVYNAAVKEAFESRIRNYRTEAGRLRQVQVDSQERADDAASQGVWAPAVDNKNQIANIEGVISQLQARLTVTQLQQNVGTGNTALGAVKQSREGQTDANKASEQRLKKMEADFHAQQLMHSMTVAEEYNFWDLRRSAFTAGSEQYNQVVAKQAELAESAAKKAHEAIDKYKTTELRGDSSDAAQVPELINRGNESMRKMSSTAAGEDYQGYADSNQLAIVNAHNQAREAEARITDEAGRSMSRYAAAVELAKVHAEEFRQVMVALQANLDNRQMLQLTNPSRENQKAVTDAQVTILQTQAKYQTVQQSDTDSVQGRSSSAAVGATDAIYEFVNTTRDAAKMMQEIVSSTMSTVNKAIVDEMTGQARPNEWRQAGRGIATNVAGNALKAGEGSLMGALGLGSKAAPKGTAGDPLHVIIAGLPGGGGGFGSDGLGGISSQWLGSGMTALGGSASSTSSKSGGASSMIGGLVTKLLPLIPGFANGGAVPDGTLAMVGEEGPELAYFGGGGHVTPNSKLPSMSGGGDNHTWNIDARGSTDPAATAAMVRDGIMQAAPHISAATIKAMDSRNSRVAPTARR